MSSHLFWGELGLLRASNCGLGLLQSLFFLDLFFKNIYWCYFLQVFLRPENWIWLKMPPPPICLGWGWWNIHPPVFSRPINFLINWSILENIKHSFVEVGLFPVITGFIWQLMFFKVENEISRTEWQIVSLPWKSLNYFSFPSDFVVICCV